MIIMERKDVTEGCQFLRKNEDNLKWDDPEMELFKVHSILDNGQFLATKSRVTGYYLFSGKQFVLEVKNEALS